MSISGKWIALKIGGMSPVLVPGTIEWSAEVEAESQDGTTAEDGGFDNPDDGVKSCTIQATLVMDVENGSYAAIKVGTLIADLKAYADINATSPVYHLPLAKVFRSTFRGEIRGRVTYEVTIRSKGTFTESDPN